MREQKLEQERGRWPGPGTGRRGRGRPGRDKHTCHRTSLPRRARRPRGWSEGQVPAGCRRGKGRARRGGGGRADGAGGGGQRAAARTHPPHPGTPATAPGWTAGGDGGEGPRGQAGQDDPVPQFPAPRRDPRWEARLPPALTDPGELRVQGASCPGVLPAGRSRPRGEKQRDEHPLLTLTLLLDAAAHVRPQTVEVTLQEQSWTRAAP